MKRGNEEDDMRDKKVRLSKESGFVERKRPVLWVKERKRPVLWVKEASSRKESSPDEDDDDDDVINVSDDHDVINVSDDNENEEEETSSDALDILANVCTKLVISEKSDDEDVILVDKNGKRIVKGSGSLGLDSVKSREDKGKAKVGDSWLSLSDNPIPLNELLEEKNRLQLEEQNRLQLEEQNRLLEERFLRNQRYEQERELRNKQWKIERHERLRARAVNFAREDQTEKIEKEDDKQLGKIVTDFSSALEMVKKRTKKPLINWTPLMDNDRKNTAPSLLELSLKVLAQNSMDIVSLKGVPDSLKRRFVDFLINKRSMNLDILKLLLEGSPTALRVKDCHWLSGDQFSTAFQNLDMKNLKVLQLDLCGQIAFEYTLPDTFGKSENSLPKLVIISLKGAARLTDKAIKILLKSAPNLHSMNLSQCSLVTETGIKNIADALGSILRELYVDECPRLDAMLIVQAIKQFKNLEVLSVAGVQGVCDRFVKEIVTANIKDLNLADCPKLTNYALELIGNTCVDLRALDISNAENLTDVGLEYLANKCRLLETLKLGGNRFSDEAVAAFLEVSGENLKDLSLNKVSKVGHNTAISLARNSKSLINLDISWCRRISNEAIGLIVDSCLSLKMLKVFGCSQINNVFLDGYSNPFVKIVGLRSTPILDHLNILEAEETLLKYSALPNEF